MNGDRSNHQGRVKVAEKAAPPPVVQRATLPPAFQKLHATMCHSERPRCHSERSEESRPGSYFRITSSPAQAADLPERRARFLAALGMTPDAAAARRLVVFGAFALLPLFVISHRPYPYAATPAPQQVKTAEPEYLTPVELKFSPDGQRIYVV